MAELLNAPETNILFREKIKNYLSLDDNENEIVDNLLKNGRQSLTKYEDDIVSEIYKKAMNGYDNELIFLLKKYFEKEWKMEYGKMCPWFLCFLEQYKNGENATIYECVLNRTANYGNRYMKDTPVLSIVLQLLFEYIDDDCLCKTNVFENLWFTVTNNGLRSIEQYSKYIGKEALQEQLRIPSALFQALCEYYRENVFSSLKNKSMSRENLHELVLNNVAEHGWCTDLKAIKDKFSPRTYKILLESLHSFHQTQNPSEKTASEEKPGNGDVTNVFLNVSSFQYLKLVM
ncbi:unnamed protein product [Rotaria socialis]|uniref:Uncharacterized protein n=1 Tax=Rotaria socialis TaxID=392032 RepID=A0A818JTY8_9BILA|nr:unnamed protein product [Rotaria socialis]CAF4847567.1 unnamed protein product [Rotaria socialis]